MEQVIKVHVGLDVHKDSIAIAVAEAGRSPGRLIGQIAHDVPRLLKALARLGAPDTVHVVYEAGPTGYGLQRALSAKGVTSHRNPATDFRRNPASGRGADEHLGGAQGWLGFAGTATERFDEVGAIFGAR